MRLYHHKTSGGAEYLTDAFIEWEHEGKSGREGVFEGAKYIVRIDGDIENDAELNVREQAASLSTAENASGDIHGDGDLASRLGGKDSGCSARVNGWGCGVEVRAHTVDDDDVIEVFANRGSNGGGQVHLGTITCGGVWTPAAKP